MRIGLINYEYPSFTENCGGGGEVTEVLAGKLLDRGHQVRIVTDNVGEASNGRFDGPVTGGHYTTFPLRALPATRRLVEWADVVNGHFTVPSSVFLPILCRNHDTSLVVTPMGSDVYNPIRFEALRPVLNQANRRILGGADRVIVPSTDVADRLPSNGAPPPSVVHYGIDPDRWPWRSRSLHEPVRILTVCRLVDRKNLATAISAVDTFAASADEAEYHIVGTGPEKDRLTRQASDTDHATVRLRGYVETLTDAYDWADLFFLPTQYEAFGMVFLEALASGLPVVTSTSGGQTDIVAPSVGRANAQPDDPDAFAKGLATVVRSYPEYQAATEGYVREVFSAERMAADYERHFEAVLA